MEEAPGDRYSTDSFMFGSGMTVLVTWQLDEFLTGHTVGSSQRQDSLETMGPLLMAVLEAFLFETFISLPFPSTVILKSNITEAERKINQEKLTTQFT